MTNDLIASIGRRLNIPGPNDNEQICRIVYSAAGQMALASLWDHTEDGAPVSIQHFKNRIAQTFDAYESLYPGIAAVLPREKTVLIDEIYSIYLRCGYFYHSAYQISPAAPAQAGYGNLTLHRGGSPDAGLFMSGLGFYTLPKKASAEGSAAAVFGLQEQAFEVYLNELLEFGEWESVTWPENTEFLRLDPPFSRGYWQQTPGQGHRVSLARYGEPNKVFAFYRYENGVYRQKPIPQWRIENYDSAGSGGVGEYFRISAALLNRYEVLPEIRAAASGDLVEVKLGYRLPPPEEAFFKLYSWPARYDVPQVFARMMARQVYPAFKKELETIGYRFVEG